MQCMVPSQASFITQIAVSETVCLRVCVMSCKKSVCKVLTPNMSLKGLTKYIQNHKICTEPKAQ